MTQTNTPQYKPPYIGRFAPSPSGPLHFGSLFCALASYLDAKKNAGQWLVRIEDIDTPRIDPSMSKVILDSLRAHGLEWDDEVIYQSQRHDLYEQYLNLLNRKALLYGCSCSRKQIKQRSGFYDGHCRTRKLPFDKHALRFKHVENNTYFTDKHLGNVTISHPIATEDSVLKRADGIYAYHLVVIADDIEQGITHIVRGNDLVETTPIHLSLFDAFDSTRPQYCHMPVLSQKPNEKLSKQHHSPAIDDKLAADNIKLALFLMGFKKQDIPTHNRIDQLIFWAIENWSLNIVPLKREILISTANGVYSEFSNINEGE